MNIVIDDLPSQPGIRGAAAWAMLIPQIVSELIRRQWQVLMLDRTGSEPLPGVKHVPFPSYRISHGAADSILIQKMCDWAAADLFISGGLTTPLVTPTMQILAFENAESEASSPLLDHVEQRLALGFSSAIVCASESALAGVREACGELGNRVLTSPVTYDEPASIIAFARAVADRAGMVQRDAQDPADREFRAKWRRVREIQAAVGFLGEPP